MAEPADIVHFRIGGEIISRRKTGKDAAGAVFELDPETGLEDHLVKAKPQDDQGRGQCDAPVERERAVKVKPEQEGEKNERNKGIKRS